MNENSFKMEQKGTELQTGGTDMHFEERMIRVRENSAGLKFISDSSFLWQKVRRDTAEGTRRASKGEKHVDRIKR